MATATDSAPSDRGAGARSAGDAVDAEPHGTSALRRGAGVALLLPLVLLAVAGVLRFSGLGEPERIYFDETYYVSDARDLLAHGVETGFAVHPPLGKWLTAAGMAVVGDNPAGWRAGAAAAGTLTVLMTYLIGLRLFRRRGVAALAALLVAVDGLAFTMSRIAMLDAFLGLFVATAAWLLLIDRDRQWAGVHALTAGATTHSDDVTGARLEWLPRRPHAARWLAGIALGLAVATKWSGLWAIAAAVLVAGVGELLWRRRLTGRALIAPGRAIAAVALPLLVVPAVLYVASYAGWFTNLDETRLADRLCPEGVCELSVPEIAQAWTSEQAAVWRFHNSLEAEHPYRSLATSWPALNRPVAYYYESCELEQQAEGTCEVEPGNVAEILGLGNPALWWLALPAYAALAWFGVRRRDWRSGFVAAFLLAQYLPWLAASRPLFLFYLVPAVPFIALALAYAASEAARSPLTRWVPAAVATLAVAAFLFWYPLYAGLEISRAAWELRMWLGSWV